MFAYMLKHEFKPVHLPAAALLGCDLSIIFLSKSPDLFLLQMDTQQFRDSLFLPVVVAEVELTNHR